MRQDQRTPATPEAKSSSGTPGTRTPTARQRAAPAGINFSQRLPWRRQTLTFTAVAAALVVVVLVVMFTDTSRTTAIQRVVPTPTPTIMPTPTQTPIVGFQQYVDPAEGFSIQYPGSWVYIPDSPGIQFDDDISNPTYEVQVIVPSDTTYAGLSGDPSDPAVWVNYTLSAVARKFQDNFQQVPGPAPSVMIGGVTWQSGVGLLTGDPNQGSFRVQVYATVYQGKPYIINLLAPDAKFSVAEKYFFTPMLQTFEFLPAKP